VSNIWYHTLTSNSIPYGIHPCTLPFIFDFPITNKPVNYIEHSYNSWRCVLCFNSSRFGGFVTDWSVEKLKKKLTLTWPQMRCRWYATANTSMTSNVYYFSFTYKAISINDCHPRFVFYGVHVSLFLAFCVVFLNLFVFALWLVCTIQSFSYSWHITGFIIRPPRCVPPVFILLSFYFWPLDYLSFFELRLLNTLLLSWNCFVDVHSRLSLRFPLFSVEKYVEFMQ
jgi:hypothetical protein